jgi:hypothetical protein
MCISGDDTRRFTLQISKKTWVAMRRNSGKRKV